MPQRKNPRLDGFNYTAENTAYFVTCRFNQAISQAIRAALLQRLQLVAAEQSYVLDALVVMPDHMHAILTSPMRPTKSLSDVVCALKSKSLYLLRKDGIVTSTLWRRGFHEHVIRNDNDMYEKMVYLMQNPVKAGLCGSASEYDQLFVRVLAGKDGATQGRPLRG